MRCVLLLLAGSSLALTGCRSAFVAMTVQNRTDRPIALLEVDYPSASFGTQNLSAGADFHYRFKVLGSGPITLLWTDAAHQDHKSSGPALKEGAEGSMTITVTPSGAVWGESLHQR